ncbi:MAG: hypothetical protein Ct9H300mP11_01650 [Chloroflexota bacterium]|nr:MAG: hypothetical protein Ct9H300mP11_01650 [Chloroflexota bacterium]
MYFGNISAAVDCWGGGVTKGNDELTPAIPAWPVDFTDGLNCPLMGLFGEEDARPSPADVAETEAELKRLGKDYEFHMSPGAGHGFFALTGPAIIKKRYRWLGKSGRFFGKHLS